MALASWHRWIAKGLIVALIAVMIPPTAAAGSPSGIAKVQFQPPVDLSLAASPSGTVAGEVRYAYDILGRLAGLVAADGTAVGFTYDELGNLLARSVFSSSDVGIVGFDTPIAAPGETLTILGTGFDPVPSENDVEVGSLAAIVSAATETSLTIEVPSGATTGVVSVTSPLGTATSVGPLYIRTPTSVAVTSVSPLIANPGDTLTVHGSGFSPEPANNKVRLPYGGSTILLRVLSASPTELQVEAPIHAKPNTGFLTVTTPSGTAASPQRVAIPPGAYTGANTVYSGHYSIGGTATITVSTAHWNAFATFEGEAGDRVSFQMTSNIGWSWIRIYDPLGNQVAGGYTNGNAFLDSWHLPMSGVYSMLIDPDGTRTGTANVVINSVPADPSATIVPGGAPVQVVITTPGQNADLYFDAEEGDRISVHLASNIGYTWLRIYGPDGSQVGGGYTNGNAYLDTLTLQSTGTYRIWLDPEAARTGTATVTVNDVPPDVIHDIEMGGAPVGYTITTPGQNANLYFEAEEGDRISLQLASNIGYSWVRVYNPSGVQVAASYNNGNAYIDVTTLQDTGTYRIWHDPEAARTGNATITLNAVPPDVSDEIEAGGDPVSYTITTPGQNANLYFDAEAGDRFSLQLASNIGYSWVRVYNPSGTQIAASYNNGNAYIDATDLPVTGTYRIWHDPEAARTGNATITLHDVPPDVSDDIEAGGDPVVVHIVAPGQNANLYFDAEEGDKISLQMTSNVGYSWVRIYNPSGAQIAAAYNNGNANIGSTTLPATGTYRIFYNPEAARTGTATFTLNDLGSAALPFGQYLLGGATPTLLAVSGPGAAARPTAQIQSTQGDEESSRPDEAAEELTPPQPEEPPAPVREVRPVEIDMSGFDFGPERWTAPTRSSAEFSWRADRPPSPWEDAPPLVGATATPAISGQVLALNGEPLQGITVSVGQNRTSTDAAGRFVVEDLTPGRHVLVVGGDEFDRSRVYPRFEIGVEAPWSGTHVLDYPIWMPQVDERRSVPVPETADRDYVVTSADIPGMELRVKQGAKITNYWGDPITELSITAVPTDRAPFPLPDGVEFPVYFTVQPGGVYVDPGVEVVYPNILDLPAGAKVVFYNYDPEELGWHVYGTGTVSKDGFQVIPDPGVVVYKLTMFSYVPGFDTWLADLVDPVVDGELAGDPVDLASGLFVMDKVDLLLPDLLPIAINRSYNSGSGRARAFGIGMSHSYDLFLRSDNPFQEVDLILPNGGKVHYTRISAGTGHADAVFEHTGTPSQWHKSKITWNGNGWDLALSDGTVYVFGNKAPLQAIRDRNGNMIRFTRQGDYYGSQTGYVTAITSTNGRWVRFTYSSNRVSSAVDNLGRTVTYTYDGSGRLHTVTDPDGGVTTYGYDGSHRMTSITDPRGITFLSNTYSGNGRVIEQTTAGEGTAEFDYILDGGAVVETRYTDPEGNTRVVEFNAARYSTTDTYAEGTADEQTTTLVRQSGTNLVTAVVDDLNRRTEFTYNPLGYVTSVTVLAQTVDASTTTYTYEPSFNLLVTVTDADSETTTFTYDSRGNLTEVEDPIGRKTEFTHNQSGQVVEVSDDLEQITTLVYDHGDLAEVTDPLGRSSRQFTDSAGRNAVIWDALGATTTVTFNKRNLATSVTNPAGDTTNLTYDPNGNLRTVQDPRGSILEYEFDTADRLDTRIDPLEAEDAYTYNGLGSLTEIIDRRGVVNRFTYDNLDRMTLARFGVTGGTEESAVTYTYDNAGRLASATDSATGAVSWTYDLFDRIATETSPRGTITYQYDEVGRRSSMKSGSDPTVSYTWNAAGDLLTVSQDGETITYIYDAIGRLVTVASPNDIITTYSYDDASQVESITYTQDSVPLGDLQFDYDDMGRIISVSGSLAGIATPDEMEEATYDIANRIITWDGDPYDWDDAGNLIDDDESTLTWNARGQLATVTTGLTTWTFAYDALGRRITINDGTTASGTQFDGANPLNEFTGSTQTATLLNGLGLDVRHARTEDTDLHTYLTDLGGSTVGLADDTGTTTTYAYTPFGGTSRAGDPTTSAYAWHGRTQDPSGLYQFRARYYHPDLGRFISEDPLGLAAGPTNPYIYANNDPVNLSDPTGLFVDIVLDVGFIAYDAYKLFTGGRKEFSANLGALGLSVLGAMIPFVTGLGQAGRAVAKPGSQRVFRAVQPDEPADVVRRGQYRNIPGIGDGKYFFPSRRQAEHFADRMTKRGMGGPYRITSGEVPQDLLRRVEQITPAGEGVAYYIHESLLQYIDNIVIYGR